MLCTALQSFSGYGTHFGGGSGTTGNPAYDGQLMRSLATLIWQATMQYI